MKKVAIIVQRAGTNIIGGAEDYALRMAYFLSEKYLVDILTTTAKDHVTWENYYESGVEKLSDRIRIFRFNIDIGRTETWQKLNNILFQNALLKKEISQTENRKFMIQNIRELPLGIQEEYIKLQGPYSKALFDFIYENQNNYHLFIFMTYLHATTFFGVDLINDKEKVYICLTLHDEPAAYLSAFRKYLKFKLLFLSEAEKNTFNYIFKDSPPSFYIINFGLEDKFEKISAPHDILHPFIIYAGRLEEGKGLLLLFDYFNKFHNEYPKLNLYLFLLGDGPLKNFKHSKVKYFGVVDENQKLSLLKRAIAFIHPSPFESLSIALIESFMMGTPALVNKKCPVLFDHIQNSQAGFPYESYKEFSYYLLKIIQDKKLRDTLSFNARNYFLNNYTATIYKKRLFDIFDSELSLVKNAEEKFSIEEIYEQINEKQILTSKIELFPEKKFYEENANLKLRIKQAIMEAGLKHKKFILRIPFLSHLSKKIYHRLNPSPFFDISNWYDENKEQGVSISKEELLKLNQFDNEEFIKAAYQLILLREPDQNGLEIYKKILHKKGIKSKYRILKSIAFSPEARQKRIKVEISLWEKLPFIIRNFLKS